MRLTVNDRKVITMKLLKHRFGADVIAACKARLDAAQDIYLDIYPAPMLARMQALPSGWLPRVGGARVAIGVACRVDYANWRTYDTAMVPAAHLFLPTATEIGGGELMLSSHTSGVVKLFDHDDPLIVRFDAAKQAAEKLGERIEATHRETTKALARFTTVEKLVKEWPEVAPFVADVAGPAHSLPAVTLRSLNKALDLPV